MSWFWLWLVILGWITYVTLKRSVPESTKAPLWVLWLVMMAPALLWVAWIINYPGQRSTLQPWTLGAIFCLLVFIFFLLYRVLLQWGASPSRPSQTHLDSPSARPLSGLTPPGSSLSGPSLSEDPTLGTESVSVPAENLQPLSHEEETLLKQCFSWSDYFLQKIEYRLQAVICQGQLRSDPTQVYQLVLERVQARFGNRFLLLLQEDLAGKPFFALVPNPQAKTTRPATDRLHRPGLALLLLACTLGTTSLVGIRMAGHRASHILGDPSLIYHGLPYALALLSILGIHELGHFWMAKRYKLQTTLPYFIPIPFFLGTFGAFIQIRSPMPNRRVVFDVGIAGPIAGFLATLPLLIWGLAHSQVLPSPGVGLPGEPSVLDFKALNPRSSILMLLVSRWVLGDGLGLDNVLNLHPVAIAGYLGLIVTAMNLMPVGQLDGGHVVHAMLGQRMGIVVSQVTRLLMLGLSMVQREFLAWALLLLFIPAVDEPALNDVSDLENRRDVLGLVSLTILLLIILPVPPMVARLILG